jgi:hypothetical protein
VFIGGCLPEIDRWLDCENDLRPDHPSKAVNVFIFVPLGSKLSPFIDTGSM